MKTMTKSKRKAHWTKAWARHSPCAKGLEFAKSTKSIAEFWRTCQRGDWMLWMIAKTCGDDRRHFGGGIGEESVNRRNGTIGGR